MPASYSSEILFSCLLPRQHIAGITLGYQDDRYANAPTTTDWILWYCYECARPRAVFLGRLSPDEVGLSREGPIPSSLCQYAEGTVFIVFLDFRATQTLTLCIVAHIIKHA